MGMLEIGAVSYNLVASVYRNVF